MADLEEEYEDDDEESEKERFLELINSVTERCEEVNLRIEIDEDGDLDEGIIVYFPEGNSDSTRSVTLYDTDDANTLLNFDFENFQFLEGYDAFYNSKTKNIYAAIAPVSSYSAGILRTSVRESSTATFLRVISPNPKEKSPNESNFELESGTVFSEKISISLMPSMQNLLTRWIEGYSLSLQISGTFLSTHDDIKNYLEELTNSLFLQIEQESGISVRLVRSRKGGGGHVNKRKRLRQPPSYTFPKVKYDRTAMTFYWYGVGAYGMPLMQYLAFYQAIEHFYPKHSKQAVIRKVQSVLKRPDFNLGRDEDIARLLERVPASGGHGGYGDELTQLKATLNDCVNEEELRGFLKKNDGEKKVYSSKALHQYKIGLESKGDNFFHEVAKRVYDIRCRIVHTKQSNRESAQSDRESAPILPYTKEETYLKHDTALVKFLALQVIVCNANASHS